MAKSDRQGNSQLTVRDSVYALEEYMGSLEEIVPLNDEVAIAPYEPEVNHYTAHGVYARQMYLPKGGIVTGAQHRFEGINIVALGMARVTNTADESVQDYVSGQVFIAPPGSKRAICALEDLVWVNVFAHDYQDEETFLKEFVL